MVTTPIVREDGNDDFYVESGGWFLKPNEHLHWG